MGYSLSLNHYFTAQVSPPLCGSSVNKLLWRYQSASSTNLSITLIASTTRLLQDAFWSHLEDGRCSFFGQCTSQQLGEELCHINMCCVFRRKIEIAAGCCCLTTVPTGSLVPAAVSYCTTDRFFAPWMFLSAFLSVWTHRSHFKGVTAHCLCLVKSACVCLRARCSRAHWTPLVILV